MNPYNKPLVTHIIQPFRPNRDLFNQNFSSLTHFHSILVSLPFLPSSIVLFLLVLFYCCSQSKFLARNVKIHIHYAFEAKILMVSFALCVCMFCEISQRGLISWTKSTHSSDFLFACLRVLVVCNTAWWEERKLFGIQCSHSTPAIEKYTRGEKGKEETHTEYHIGAWDPVEFAGGQGLSNLTNHGDEWGRASHHAQMAICPLHLHPTDIMLP